jgi:hypothetical protein
MAETCTEVYLKPASMSVGLVLLIFAASAQNVSPPPISRVDCHKGAGNWKNSLTFTEFMGQTAVMDFFELTQSTDDDNGWSLQFGAAAMSFLTFIGGSCYGIDELIGGETLDVAGEVVGKSASLASYYGVTFSYVGGNASLLGDFSMLIIDAKSGFIAELPVSWAFYLQPYFTTSVYTYMSGSFMGMEVKNGSWFQGVYPGMDIVVTPFRNDRSWKISLGMLLPIVKSNAEGNLTFTIGLKREWGKYFTGTSVEFW